MAGMLQYGSQGNDVKDLQRILNKNGYSLSVDGIFGAKTRDAVKDYQSKNRLTIDGIVGDDTWARLGTLYTGKATPTIPKTKTEVTATTQPTFNNKAYKDTTEGKTNKGAMDDALSNFSNYGSHNWENKGTYDQLLKDYLNRGDFSYDLNGDALYQQYKDKFIQQGKMGSADVMGQAAAMTGGYGSSYSQSVGHQAYQASLDKLNDVVPELMQMAYDRYNQKGADMLNQLGVLDADYNRSFGEWETGYNMRKDKYGIASDNYYKGADLYGTELDRNNSITQQDWDNAWRIVEDEENKRRWEAEHGLQERQVALQEKAYEDSQKDDSEAVTGETYGSGNVTIPVIPAGDGNTTYEHNPKTGETFSVEEEVKTFIKNGSPRSKISAYLRNALKSGIITDAEYNRLKELYVPQSSSGGRGGHYTY